MPIILTVPTLQRTRVAPPVKKEEAAAQQAAVQDIPSIPKRNRFVIPSLPCSAAAAIKKGKTSAKRWKDFNRQAARREKAVELSVGEYMRLIAQPCLYCGAEENSGVDRARNNESYTRENSVPCCSPCNMAKRNSNIRAFVQRARAISKSTRAFVELKRSSTV